MHEQMISRTQVLGLMKLIEAVSKLCLSWNSRDEGCENIRVCAHNYFLWLTIAFGVFSLVIFAAFLIKALQVLESGATSHRTFGVLLGSFVMCAEGICSLVHLKTRSPRPQWWNIFVHEPWNWGLLKIWNFIILVLVYIRLLYTYLFLFLHSRFILWIC